MEGTNIDYIHNIIISNCEGLKEVNDENNEIRNFHMLYIKNMSRFYSIYNSACKNDDSNINKCGDKYIAEIGRLSLIEKNNNLVIKFKNSVEHLVSINFNSYQSASIDYKTCTCGGIMKIVEINCYFKCENCGEIVEFTGIVSDKIIKPNGRTVVLKNNYKHKLYFNSIYKNIFALETFVFNDKNSISDIEERLEDFCEMYSILPINVKCSWFRKELSNVKKNAWFPHVNILKKNLTGYHPPRLTDKEVDLLHMYYTLYQRYYATIKDPGKSYLRCEFIIFKILDQILNPGERKRKILSHIPLPKQSTLEKLDIKYEEVCEASKGILKYDPTIRSDY